MHDWLARIDLRDVAITLGLAGLTVGLALWWVPAAFMGLGGCLVILGIFSVVRR